ncbi:hypothetical protein EPUS_06100 [Endocarpon pusillum Z07020]|uniref:Uncharacterized protein n=1 Tax=Endocarpon pusillum (strain Z07020 / HMAS-L-300199) TaxID=1263415 RepID=U1HSX6_ENDPU|nr:uncharacterized protein EPUS_06100 [Endocarpon pusillum Z07020]ERF72344.1 hypothetical protein EPUS_06100 [Endocarpon pusillum Z07020]
MDAPDGNRDVKLYRASADLLLDISRRLNELLEDASDATKPSEHQLWISDSRVERIISLLDLFQEWPQLLDPLLPKLVNPLIGAFLRCLVNGRYGSRPEASTPVPKTSPLPSAICCILNTLCKVRGVKVITRFLNNEPRYLEPMLEALLLNQPNLVWQERYIILLWLSHLVLTPFDLQSVSSSDENVCFKLWADEEFKHLRLPIISKALLHAGLENLGVAGKERESASLLIVRLALRPDLQRVGLLDELARLMLTSLLGYAQRPTATTYECLGYLSILSVIMKSGSADDVSPFLISTFDFGLKAATAGSAEFSMIRASAPARKMLVVILRASMLHLISLNSSNRVDIISIDTLYEMLEGMVQYLLNALGDKDTPVRLAASKALSMLAHKLDEGMKAEVVQAVLDTLEEDILYEKPDSGDPVTFSPLMSEDMQTMLRNVTAVNSLKWQGLLLTLGHLLFRRTAPPDQLPPILRSLLSGLDFEQRSAGGTSLGGVVRDAACFGLWSLARKYATPELQRIEPASVLPALGTTLPTTGETSVLQIVANQLVVSACLDPSGNIRRGSSAALQELIGRHPDTVTAGIALIQVIDYHAVARRSRAMLDVAHDAAKLADVYRWALLNALLGWRGVRAVDEESRRSAATAISELASMESSSDSFTVLETLQKQSSKLPIENSKTIAEMRHGLLMTMSRILDTLDLGSTIDFNSTPRTPIASLLHLLLQGISIDGQLLGSLKGKFIPELVLEGAVSLISSLMRRAPETPSNFSDDLIDVLELCLTRADHDIALVACADAAFELLRRLPETRKVCLVENWLNAKHQRHSSFSSKGRILALGSTYPVMPKEKPASQTGMKESARSRVFARLRDFIQGEWPIETHVIAIRSLTSIIPHLGEEDCAGPLCAALDNYTNDQRGDVGSLARLEAVKTVSALLSSLTQRPDAISEHDVQQLVQRLFRLAGEKLDKLRFEAWKCIQVFLGGLSINSPQFFSHVSDVSSQRYFSALLQYLQVPWLQSCILQGVVHSTTSGTEELMRVSRLTLIQSIVNASSDCRAGRVLEMLVTLLETLYTDERQATPLLETIAFLLEQGIEPGGEFGPRLSARKLWNVVRKAHFKSTNIRKLEAAVKIYGALAVREDIRSNALGKLRDLLLHPYPSIRKAAADALYTELPNGDILTQDWSRPAKDLKEVVAGLTRPNMEPAGIA